MSILIKVALVIVALVLAAFAYAVFSVLRLENPTYKVVYEGDGIEYRQYEAYLVSETVITQASNYRAAGNEGFRRLFKYITGANTNQTKVSMTVPVAQTESSQKVSMTVPVQQTESSDGWRVAFMLPTEYTLETAPQPTDSRVQIRAIPGKLTAVLRYSGNWTESSYDKKKAALVETLQQASITKP